MSDMKKLIFVVLVLAQMCVSTCLAQTEDLFIRGTNGSIIQKDKFLKFTSQPDEDLLATMNYQTYVHQVTTVYSPNHQYHCQVEIHSEENDPDFDEYVLIKIVDSNNHVLFKRYGIDNLTTTKLLSRNNNDHNYYIQIPLDDTSYALIFSGWYWYPSTVPGEMIIVVVNKNVATFVYAGVGASISSNGYTLNADSFSMDFVSDLSGLRLNEDTGQFEEDGAGLNDKTKYTLYKDGNMLKLRTWR